MTDEVKIRRLCKMALSIDKKGHRFIFGNMNNIQWENMKPEIITYFDTLNNDQTTFKNSWNI